MQWYRNTQGGVQNVAVGNYALDELTSGDHCTCVGYGAGSDSNGTTTGTEITVLGAQSHASANDGVRQIILGYNVTGAANDSLTFGDGSTD